MISPADRLREVQASGHSAAVVLKSPIGTSEKKGCCSAMSAVGSRCRLADRPRRPLCRPTALRLEWGRERKGGSRGTRRGRRPFVHRMRRSRGSSPGSIAGCPGNAPARRSSPTPRSGRAAAHGRPSRQVRLDLFPRIDVSTQTKSRVFTPMTLMPDSREWAPARGVVRSVQSPPQRRGAAPASPERKA